MSDAEIISEIPRMARAFERAACTVGIGPTADDIRREGALPGDLFYDPNGYRGTTTWAVAGALTAYDCCDGAGYAEISVEVSQLLDDPVTFYSEVTDETLYQGVTRIMMHTEAHQAVLQKQTGGRPIHASRSVCWETCNMCYTIETPTSPDCPNGGDYVLDADTPQEYLDNNTHLEHDPVTATARHLIALEHQNAVAIITAMVVNPTVGRRFVSVRNLPKSVEGGSWGSSLRFLEFERDGRDEVVAILCGEPNGSWRFTRQVCELKHGSYAGVTLWTARKPNGGSPAYVILNLN